MQEEVRKIDKIAQIIRKSNINERNFEDRVYRDCSFLVLFPTSKA